MKALGLSIWKPRDILKGVEIHNPSRNASVEGGVRDPRLGTTDNTRCVTCGRSRHTCPGHWGYIKLEEPVYHPFWLPHVLHALKLKCLCGHVFEGEGSLAKRARAVKRCPKCKKLPSWKYDRTKKVVLCNGQPMSSREVHQRLGNLSHLMVTVLPVPPSNIRPPLISGTRIRGENAITYRLIQILRVNQKVKRIKTQRQPRIVLEHAIQSLQTQVEELMDHEKSRKQVNARAYASYASRLKGKEGTVRDKCMGKRVNFCARGVITTDDSLKLSELGVPASVADTLTKPVKVTDYNMKELENQVVSGMVRYVRKNNQRVDVSKTAPALEVGDTCEVKLQNGDLVLFNRQPSLHAASIMCHEVRIRPGHTFALNSACLGPYAADCDGDEMNLFLPQTPEALAEAGEILAVRHNIMSGQSNRPIIGPIQDTVLGIYRICADTFTASEAMRLRGRASGPATGLEILADLIPLDHWTCGGVRLVHGVLEGRITKSTINGHGGLVQVICNDVGTQEAIDFIHAMQNLAHAYFDLRGFSIGIEDTRVDAEFRAYCNNECDAAFAAVKGKEEEEVNERLNQCRETLGKACLAQAEKNNFAECVRAGAKGNMSNLVWILGSIGQQNQGGKRPTNQWTGRTLPHVVQETPVDRGFITNNYTTGLQPREFWFACASAREGLVDTAIKTSQTGYVERKLMKALENCRTRHGRLMDGDRIIEFKYGDDGLAPERDEKVPPLDLGDLPMPVTWWEDLEYTYLLEYRDAAKVEYSTIPVGRWHYHGDGSLQIDQAVYQKVQAITCKMPFKLRAYVFVSCCSHMLRRYNYGAAQFQELMRRVERAWHLAQVPDGDGVGAKTAHGIGERTTQLTLRTFHYAGISQVTLGIPRIREILDTTRNPSTPMRCMKMEDPEDFVNKHHRVRLRDIMVEPKPEEPGEMDLFWSFPDPGGKRNKPYTRIQLYPWCDAASLRKALGCYIAYTDGPRMTVHVYGTVDPNLTIKGDMWCHVTMDGVETKLPLRDCLQRTLSSTSNDIWEVYQTLGIEAARETIIRELRRILDHYGVYLNVRHLLTLASWMCHAGEPTPLTRHGLKKINSSVVFRATFEQVVQTLHNAAVKGVVDPLAGISECVLSGKLAHFCPADTLVDFEAEEKFKIPKPDNDPFDVVEAWIPQAIAL